MQRAYSVLTVKSFDDGADHVTIRGIATTPSTDKMGDIVVSEGAIFKTPMPLLWQHRHAEPVGQVTFAKATKEGIPFEATLPIIKEAGNLKDRVDEAIQSLKYNLVSAVSIGFSAVNGAVEQLKSGGLKFNKWNWHELSLVTIPANSDAVISAVKSIDQSHLPANGQDDGAVIPPGETGERVEPMVAKRGPVKLIKRKQS